jgi:hypothetical protein
MQDKYSITKKTPKGNGILVNLLNYFCTIIIGLLEVYSRSMPDFAAI